MNPLAKSKDLNATQPNRNEIVRVNEADLPAISVNKRNARAIAAYQRNGFVIADSVVTDIGSGFVMDDYIMAKELG